MIKRKVKYILEGWCRSWRRASTLSAAESYPTSKVRDSGPECQAAMVQEWLGGATPHPRSGAARRRNPAPEVRAVAGRSYPMFKASGGKEKTPHVQGQGWPGEATSRLRPGAVTRRSHPEPEARGGSWEEPPTPKARDSGQEEQLEEPWLSRHRRA